MCTLAMLIKEKKRYAGSEINNRKPHASSGFGGNLFQRHKTFSIAKERMNLSSEVNTLKTHNNQNTNG